MASSTTSSTVLLLPGLPISVIGLVALPWQGRGLALRPLLIVSLAHVPRSRAWSSRSTTWGTFLHAAGPVARPAGHLGAARPRRPHRPGRRRLGWTKPVAWLGPRSASSVRRLFTVALLPSFGAARAPRRRSTPSSPGGWPPPATRWTHRRPGDLRLPDLAGRGEASPLSLCPMSRPRTSWTSPTPAFPGTRLLVIASPDHGRWPAVLDRRDPDAACFRELDLGGGRAAPDPLAAFASSSSSVHE